MKLITLISGLVLGFSFAQAQILIEDPQGSTKGGEPALDRPSAPKAKTGKAAAREYFTDRPRTQSSAPAGPRYLSVHIGGFISDDQYRWGRQERGEDVANIFGGVTYKVGEWEKSMDLMFRAELISYDIDDESPTKLSFMPMITFPDSASDFPLYFGGGLGAGLFLSQAGDESDLSFDYQLVTGVRFPGVFNERTGITFELAYKGHVHLLSSGQFDGTSAAIGAVFQF